MTAIHNALSLVLLSMTMPYDRTVPATIASWAGAWIGCLIPASVHAAVVAFPDPPSPLLLLYFLIVVITAPALLGFLCLLHGFSAWRSISRLRPNLRRLCLSKQRRNKTRLPPSSTPALVTCQIVVHGTADQNSCGTHTLGELPRCLTRCQCK